MEQNRFIQFEEMREFLNSIPSINSGGCGVAALAMYRWVEKNMPDYKADVIFHMFHRSKDHYTNNKKLIKTNQFCNDLVAPSHIGIQIKNVTPVLDSEKSLKKDLYGFVIKTNSEDVLINALNNVDTWNPMFNRKKRVPRIEQHLGIDLSDVIQHDTEDIDMFW